MQTNYKTGTAVTWVCKSHWGSGSGGKRDYRGEIYGSGGDDFILIPGMCWEG